MQSSRARDSNCRCAVHSAAISGEPGRVVRVQFNTIQITADGLVHLKEMAKRKILSFCGTRVAHAGVAESRGRPRRRCGPG